MAILHLQKKTYFCLSANESCVRKIEGVSNAKEAAKVAYSAQEPEFWREGDGAVVYVREFGKTLVEAFFVHTEVEITHSAEPDTDADVEGIQVVGDDSVTSARIVHIIVK